MSGGRRKTCLRDGCDRLPQSDHKFCSAICRKLRQELAAAQRVREALAGADRGLDARAYAALSAAADAWSEYQRLIDELEAAALSVGMSRQQWDTVRYGSV